MKHFAFFFFLSGMICTLALQAQPRGGLVLPFQIEGKASAIKKFSTEPASDFQTATHFLLEQYYDYPFFSLAKSKEIMQELNFTTTTVLSPSRASQFCRRSDATYLIAGSAYMHNKQDLLLSLSVFSCRSSRVSTTQKIRARSYLRLQGELKKLLSSALPFARPRPPFLTTSSRDGLDLVALLDFSGSMRRDIPEILEQLSYLKTKLSANSRLGAVSIENGDRVAVLRMSANWPGRLQIFGRKVASGEVSFRGIEKALNVLERHTAWKGKRLVLFFTDARLSQKLSSRLLFRLHGLKATGMDFCFFPLSGQDQKSRKAWGDAARFLQSKYAVDLVYGLRVFLAGAGNTFFIQRGSRFFFTKHDITAQLQSDRLDWEQLTPIVTTAYSAADLNLSRLPQAFAHRQQDKVLRQGAYISNLAKSVSACVHHSSVNAAAQSSVVSRALIKSAGKAFWIHADKQTLSVLQKYQHQKMYIGLHWKAGRAGQRLENLPAPLYIRKASQVPRLFLWKWSQLQKVPLRDIRREDIWFIEAEVIRVKDEAKTYDIRR